MGRKDFRSFEEVLRSVAEQKAATAKARFVGTDPTVEKPRDVYVAACAAIAQSLVADGFHYAKSKQALDRAIGGLIHRVSFQSSRNNIAGQSVVMWMHANVRCKELATWRSRQSSPLRNDDWIAGGMPQAIDSCCRFDAFTMPAHVQSVHPVADRQRRTNAHPA